MQRLLTCTRRLGRRATALARDQGGAVNVMVMLAMLPILGVVGLGVDYGMALSGKTRLDRAADAAALAGVVTAKAYIAANSGQEDVIEKALAAGRKQAARAFNLNAGNVSVGTVTLTPPTVERSGQTLNAEVTYSATIPNTFGKLFRAPTTTVSNTIKASADLASYLDFYLMVDVSGSMGLPTTDKGMKDLAAVNKDMEDDYKQGCQFACHFPGYSGWGYAAGKIQLRSDAVNNAVCALLKRASTPIVPKQYRIGIYPFINRLATLAPLTDSGTSLAALNRAAKCTQKPWPQAFTNLLDTGATQLYTGANPATGTGSGGTHFETSLPQMKAAIKTFGKGSTLDDTKPFVFIITDGMQNHQHYFTRADGGYTYPGRPSQFKGYSDAWWDYSQPAKIDSNLCSDLKSAGATISILHIPYIKIEFVDNEGNIARENRDVNKFSPELQIPLRECASPGFFYTANTPADITASLGAMFDQALRVARLTR